MYVIQNHIHREHALHRASQLQIDTSLRSPGCQLHDGVFKLESEQVCTPGVGFQVQEVAHAWHQMPCGK